jgi:hypothetical protein
MDAAYKTEDLQSWSTGKVRIKNKSEDNSGFVVLGRLNSNLRAVTTFSIFGHG